MKEEKVKFFTAGNLKLDGSYYYPDTDQGDERKPIIIVCSGFTGLKNIHPERYARAWTPKGFVCFGFDYRGFCDSDGERGKVILFEQVQDIISAVRLVKSRAKKEGRKVVLAGWGMAGGLIIDAAKVVIECIDAIVVMNGFYNARRVQKALRGAEGYEEFLAWVNERGYSAAEKGNIQNIDPFDIYPLDPVSKEYVDTVLRKNPDYGLVSDISFADSLLGFNPEGDVSQLVDLPLLIAHGADNALHPIEEANSLYQKYPGPKDLFTLDGAGHTEWMLDDNPLFVKFSNHIAEWIQQFSSDSD